jgi:hypothetical protein
MIQFKNRIIIGLLSLLTFTSIADNLNENTHLIPQSTDYSSTSKVEKLVDEEQSSPELISKSTQSTTISTTKKLSFAEKLVVKKITKKLNKLSPSDLQKVKESLSATKTQGEYFTKGIIAAIVGLVIMLIGWVVGIGIIGSVGALIFVIGAVVALLDFLEIIG